MAEVELVIKIPEEEYRWIKKSDNNIFANIAEKECMLYAIKNGIPLPKGHGRLIDVNDLLDDIGLEDNDYNRDVNTGEIVTLESIDRILTIIEADKEESEEKK